jgi:hypothetical protein
MPKSETETLGTWASGLRLSLLQRVADVYADLRDLEMRHHALAGDHEIGNAELAAGKIYATAIRRLSRRLNALTVPGFSDDRQLPRAEDVGKMLEGICFVRLALGLPVPAIRPAARDDGRWWEEGAPTGRGFEFLVERPGRVDRTASGGLDTAWPMRWELDVDGWAFDVADDGTVVKATQRK